MLEQHANQLVLTHMWSFCPKYWWQSLSATSTWTRYEYNLLAIVKSLVSRV